PRRTRGRRANERTDTRVERTDGGGAGAGPRARRALGAASDARRHLPAAHRRGRRGMRLLAHQFRFEQLLFWRSREAAFFVFTFPLILFVLLSSVYTGRYLGRPASWSVLAGILGYGAANTGFGGLTLLLVGRREMGFLKRVRSTPIPGATYLTAVLPSILLVFLLQA